ncbi:MAG: hypothetical protein IJ704_04590 [Bacilli bacterium]|nr:hypothetical protein [Bacilli bacterium]
MNYLNKLGFTKEQIATLENDIAEIMVKALSDNRKLVSANVEYLLDLGVKNIYEIFKAYYELFLIDHSNFMDIFNKYDREDLVEKLAKNVAIVEYL